MTAKPYNGGRWTQARFNSFIKGTLRRATFRWGPKNDVKKAARVSRGKYMCAGYKEVPHVVPASLPPKPGNKKRINNAVVDHIRPIVERSFISWDDVINDMFCEADNLQVLCHSCHSHKTEDERHKRNER